MKVVFGVPYYSQWLDVKGPDWQRRACGIVALKMTMEFSDKDTNIPDIDELIKQGLALANAYDPKFGWVHDGLVALAKSFGFGSSFRKEWQIDGSPISFSAGIASIVSILEENIPVLASVKSGTGGHLILLIGFKKEGDALKGFYYHDPDAKKASEGMDKFISAKDFLEFWKGRIVVVKK